MDSKLLVSVLWLFHFLAIVFAVPRRFTGNGYMEYNIISVEKHKAIYSDEDELKLTFNTVQPSGLLFQSTSSGGVWADYITLELVGGRLRFAVRYGYQKDKNDAHQRFLGKDLDNGRTHTVNVNHKNKVTTIILDDKTQSEREEKKIDTYFKRLDIDRSIYVGGAPNFKVLSSVQSNANFMGCLSEVIFKTLMPQSVEIDFLKGEETVTYPSDMTKDCTSESYSPFTFSAAESYFKCDVNGLAAASGLTGSFVFRTYEKSGTLIKQTNGNNGFEITYSAKLVKFSLKIDGQSQEIIAQIDYGLSELTFMNNGNWHQVKFNITTSSIILEVGTKRNERPVPSLPEGFFLEEVTAGGYVGCMRNLTINKLNCKPDQNSKIKNVEWKDKHCNITDFCVFSPCLHGGKCTQTGKGFTCSDCEAKGYKGDVCQFSIHHSTCDSLKRDKTETTDADKNYTLDVDGPGPIKPQQIFCNMSADPPITGIFTKNIAVRLYSSGPFISQAISYVPSLATAKALAMNSKTCQQYIEFGCRKNQLLEGKASSWVAANGVFQNYWGGGSPESKACECWNTKSCLDKTKRCNCDAKRDSWTSDYGYLNSSTLLPVTELVFKQFDKSGEANYTVGRLNCNGNISNTATFVNEDGFILLDPWGPPSDGVISLYFKTPYAKGTLLYNGADNEEYFHLRILNETTVRLLYNIGNGVNNVDLKLPDNKKLNDRSWHKVVIYRNMKEFGLKLDNLDGRNLNPLFLERNLDVDTKLRVGTYPYDVSKGFVGCIRGLTINGKVQNLCKLAANRDYVECGCGAACAKHACKHGGKCLDNYNVYSCDCSKTPFYGYFCHQDKGASFDEKDSQLTYEYPAVASVLNVDIVVGFKVGKDKPCAGDIVRIDSRDTDQYFLLTLNSESKKLRFYFKGNQGEAFDEFDPPQGTFCEGRHTFAVTRRGKKLNYTIDEVKKPKTENPRIDGPFSKMETITIGKQGDKGFKGCITGVKITRGSLIKPEIVEPIKAYFYDGITKGYSATDVSPADKEKCGSEPKVPPKPTPRIMGPLKDLTTSSPKTGVEVKQEQDNRTAIIVVVVLILVLLLVVLAIVIYWYWARHKGEYHTHEDDEELKSMDPYIDRSAPKKPQAEEPEKKKEWYI